MSTVTGTKSSQNYFPTWIAGTPVLEPSRYGMEASQVVSLPTTQMSTQEIRFLPVALEVEVTDDVGVPGGNVVTGPEIYIRHSVALMCSAVVKVGTRNLHILLAQPETCCRPRG